MITASNVITSKANSYIFAEESKKAKDEFIINNGFKYGSIKGPFNNIDSYIYIK